MQEVVSVKKKESIVRGRRGGLLFRVVSVDPTEKVTLEQRLEVGKKLAM